MEMMETLTMLVERSIAEELKDKGFAEVALRRADARFRAIPKCALLNNSDSTEQSIAEAAMQLLNEQTSGMNGIQAAINSLEKNANGKLDLLSESVRGIAGKVDGLCVGMKTVSALSFINAGLSLANLAVTVVGFMMVNKKLDRINGRLSDIETKLNQISKQLDAIALDVKKISDRDKNAIINEGLKLIMLIRTRLNMIQDGTLEIDKDDALLIDTRTYISTMLANFRDNALETDIIVNIINNVMPAYTLLLNEYTTYYNYKKGKLPVNYEAFISLYDELAAPDVRSILINYLILEVNIHVTDAINAANIQTMLAFNGRVQIEDQVTIHERFKHKAAVEEFEKSIDDCVSEWTEKIIPFVAQTSGTDEESCRNFFLLSA